MKRYLTAASLLMLVGMTASVRADETRTEGLNLELTPYFWAAGIDGKLDVGNESVHFNRGFSDLWDNTDAAFMGLAVISYDRFVLYADYDYLSLSNDDKTRRGIVVPIGTKATADTSLDVGTYGGGYRFNTFGTNTIDVLVGAQLTNLDLKLKAGTVKLQNKDSLTDTVVMLRPSFQLSERWRFNPTLAYGVSGDSDTTYTMMPQLQYQFSDSFALRFGYKKLYYKFKDGNSNNELDSSFSGAFLGVGWTFPVRSERPAPPPPAPVAKPAPAPVVAAAPKDSDGDGVPDGTDACPNTPKGTKVDARGCPIAVTFDLTVEFAFNSAEINDLSFRELRSAMTFMREHSDTKALVEGNTDNVGQDSYNQTLSERRADAVKDVLVKSGIEADRLTTVGYGETRPVAPNDTEAGRAKNRRVSIVVK